MKRSKKLNKFMRVKIKMKKKLQKLKMNHHLLCGIPQLTH